MRVSHTKPNAPQSREGFALLMVVACLLLVTVAMVGVSRRSLLLALEGADVADELQEHWGRVSLQRAALQAAAVMYGGEPPPLGPQAAAAQKDEIADEPMPPQWAPLYVWRQAVGEREYTVVMADESAKANLNTAVRLKSPEAAHALAVSLAGNAMNWLSLPQQTTARQKVEPIRSWGQVLPIGSRERGSLAIHELPQATARLTIWGDGKVNLLRAPQDVLLGLSRLIVSDGESRDWIREFTEAFPAKPPDLVFRELGLEDHERMALLDLLALRSTTLSVWILDNQPASTHTLCLAHRAGTGGWTARTFRYTQ